MHKSINKSMEAQSGRGQGRFKSLMEHDNTPKATRKPRFEGAPQHPTINISANQVQFNNSFCLANIAINNIKSTVKSRERSNGERHRSSNTTTHAQAKLKFSSNNKKTYFQLDPQSFQMANLFPQTDTHKGSSSLYSKIQAFKNGTLVGNSIDALKDAISPNNRAKRREPTSQDRSVQQHTRETFLSQHQKTDDSFGHREKTVQTIVPSRTVDSIGSDPETAVKLWEDMTLPLSPDDAVKHFGQFLNDLERKEITQYMNIFYLGHKALKKLKSQYDDDKGDYRYVAHDHIGYRYEILEALGKGSFGSVVRVFDHKRREEAALKIIRSKKKFFNQALVELKILKFIKDNDPQNTTNIVKIKDFVIFRNHVCIVFELLSINLYEFLKSNNFSGISLELIRRFAIQILQSLMFLEKAKIVHCDLKPENILLKQINKSGIKIVDFGSSCFINERVYTYIQSRFYRAPEVILGMPYSTPIDMWSFGCIISELFMGYPLFPGENEQEQMQMFMELLGAPKDEFLEPCQRRAVFFAAKAPYTPNLPPNSKGKVRLPGSKQLNHYLKCQDELFVSFVKACFTWDMGERMKAAEALVHPWILQGLPGEIRLQHLIQMQINAPHLQLEEQIRGVRQPQPEATIVQPRAEVSPIHRNLSNGRNPESVERKHPAYNNYFLKKQPGLTISLNKAQSHGKEVQSTKHANTTFTHQGTLSTKNNKVENPQKKHQFIFNTINNDLDPRNVKPLAKQNRSYQFNII